MASKTASLHTSTALAGIVEVAFSLDTTGSMYAILVELRRKLKATITDLHRTIPGLRVAILVHGDDANAHEKYSIKSLDFTASLEKIHHFIDTCGDTYGGGPHANYELVLQEARKLSWTSDKAKALVILGDEVPHRVGQYLPTRRSDNKVDWENELKLLHGGLGVNVFGVHCLPGMRRGSETFYRALAARTNGHYLTLSQFDLVPDLVKLCCYRVADGVGDGQQVSAFEQELRAARGGRLDRNRDQWFTETLGRARSNDYAGDDLEAVPAGQYQQFSVVDRLDVKTFCAHHGLEFKKGHIYQRLDENRPKCEVSDKKLVILRDLVTGDLYSGRAARHRLGLPDHGYHTLNYRDVDTSRYEAYIQSTSYNRKLEPGQRVLYNMEGVN